MKRALILNYHQLVESESQPYEPRFSVRYEQFVQQMKMIQALEIPVISLNDWLNNENLHEFSVLLTFDDGHKSAYDLALPILRELNFQAAFFPHIDSVGSENHISWERIKELHSLGFTIGSHGITHTDLRTLSNTRMARELRESKTCLEEKIGSLVKFLALPFGGNNRAIAQEAKASGYTHILTTQRRINLADGSTQLHRWNIKSTTSLVEFEKMLRLNYTLITRKKIVSSMNQVRSRSMIYLKNKFSPNDH